MWARMGAKALRGKVKGKLVMKLHSSQQRPPWRLFVGSPSHCLQAEAKCGCDSTGQATWCVQCARKKLVIKET